LRPFLPININHDDASIFEDGSLVMPEQLNNQESSAPKQSRYQRVQEILSEAAGGVCPSYEGYGEFWRLPLAEFLEVTIYGVRMIAPADDSPPDPCAEPLPSDSQTSSGRGETPEMNSCCHSTPEAPYGFGRRQEEETLSRTWRGFGLDQGIEGPISVRRVAIPPLAVGRPGGCGCRHSVHLRLD
jgi:hypothetical protein